jgi:hypothetical protein
MKVSHRITRLATAGLIAGALVAPGASARPAPLDSPVPAGGEPVVIAPEPVVQRVDDGFDWGSAAIGAGGASAIILLVSAGGITHRHRNQHLGVAR